MDVYNIFTEIQTSEYVPKHYGYFILFTIYNYLFPLIIYSDRL